MFSRARGQQVLLNLLIVSVIGAGDVVFAQSPAPTYVTSQKVSVDRKPAQDQTQTPTETHSVTVPPGEKAPSWYERMNITADFRYRHEYINKEEADSSNHRQRLRARLNATTKILDQVKTVLQLASGNQETRSTNVTQDQTYSKKGIDIDMAYADWAANKSTNVLLGKVKNTLYFPVDSELLWDFDTTFEGATLNWKCDCEGWSHFANAGVYWFDERDREAKAVANSDNAHSDTYQYSTQLGTKWKNDDYSLTAGLGYHVFSPIQNQQLPRYDNKFLRKGNSEQVNADNDIRYATNFDVAELFMTFTIKAGSDKISLYTNAAVNTATAYEKDAHLVGVSYGTLKNSGDWLAAYNYRRVKKDAVVAVLTDSDFADGETDSRGHRFVFRYQIVPGITSSLIYIKAERDVSTDPQDYDRGQVDFAFSM